jgi:hopene-associated glycosyltransferase HpnB
VILHVLAALPLLAWLYLMLARGGFWQVSHHVASASAQRCASAQVVAVIPARDEAAVIGDTVRSLLLQKFAGSLQVIVVDDGSVDGTGRAALEAAQSMQAAERLSVIKGTALPAGWTGKLWAMSQGVAAASALRPDFLLLTDADIHHDPDNLASLLSIARSGDYALVSFMVQLSVATLAEKCLIPAFVFFFFMLYPPRATAARASAIAGAAGGCMLTRPQALEHIGGLQSIQSQLIDDCALARAIKRSGGSIWLGLTRTAHSTRRYGSFAEVGRMISRSAFYQLDHSWWLLLGTIVGLGLTYLLPVVLLWLPDWRSKALGLAAWLVMSVCFAPTVRFYRLSLLWSICLPAIAMFYAAATLHSAWEYLLRRGGHWKGRVQDVRTG